eukprot:gene1675-444_t
MTVRQPLSKVDFNTNIKRFDLKEEIEFGLCLKDERRKLVEQIIKNKEDPETWRELLAYDYSHKETPETISKIFHKATKELPPLKLRKNPSYVNLWLHFILFLSKHSSLDEAKDSLKYMKNQRIGLEEHTFYLVWAQVEFNGNKQKSKMILEKGASKKSMLGVEILNEALQNIIQGKDISQFHITSLSKKITDDPTIQMEKSAMSVETMEDNEETKILKVESSNGTSGSTFGNSLFSNSHNSGGIFFKNKNPEKKPIIVMSDNEDDQILKMLKKRKMMNPKEPEKQEVHPSPSTTENDTVTVNNTMYTKISVVGKGGSGKVYKVFDSKKNVFALKKVKLRGVNRQTMMGFINEIQMLKQLRGKKTIVQYVDSEIRKSDATLYLVMECGDTDLSSLLKSKKLNQNQIRLYWEQMLEAVQTIHEEKIIHSDLKPANFLLVKGMVKLIDFGIANKIQNDTTNIVRDSQVGTVNYMSPEAINENPSASLGSEKPKYKLGRSSDIWSLGCILYQMTYGRTPFSHLTMIKAIHAITDENYEISFPPISNEDPQKRMTIPELLQHPFLTSNNVVDVSGEKSLQENQISVDQNELLTLIKHVSNGNEMLSKEIFECLQKGNDVSRFLKQQF